MGGDGLTAGGSRSVAAYACKRPIVTDVAGAVAGIFIVRLLAQVVDLVERDPPLFIDNDDGALTDAGNGIAQS